MLREYIQEYCSLYPFYSIGLEKKIIIYWKIYIQILKERKTFS